MNYNKASDIFQNYPSNEVLQGIGEASQYIDMDQLCLSPLCGFSSIAIGDLVSVEDQIAKLCAIGEIAGKERG